MNESAEIEWANKVSVQALQVVVYAFHQSISVVITLLKGKEYIPPYNDATASVYMTVSTNESDHTFFVFY